MPTNRKRIVLNAVANAYRIREKLNINHLEPICIYDITEKLDVEVRFLDALSMEGMYSKEPNPIILICSERPPGRQAFTCAHELAHHVYGHGTKVDEFVDSSIRKPRNNIEFIADCFAAFLLMPKAAIERAITIRNWEPFSMTPEQIFTVAGLFGVGYKTLLSHMYYSLNMLSKDNLEENQKVQPKVIRSNMIGHDFNGNLIVVDTSWNYKAIDINVGDIVALPSDSQVENNTVEYLKKCNDSVLFTAKKPGIVRTYNDTQNWASFIRVSRKNYVGRSIFRHLEDPEYGKEWFNYS